MDYIEWNNSIAEYFFNEDMEEREVYLFISKSEIIEIGHTRILNKSDEEIWNDFINALKSGLDGKIDDSDILNTLLWIYAYYQYIIKTNPEKFPYPPYLAYLILFIIPLAEESQLSYNSYYQRINNFLVENKLPILKNQNANFNWNEIWQHLEYWSFYIKNGEFGFFEIQEFVNPNWVYVSKPMSQSFIKPSSLKKLPSLFFHNNILPNQNLNDKQIKAFIINCSRNIGINAKLLEAIKNNDEVGQLISNIVKKFYLRWNGEEISYTKREIKTGIIKPWVISVLKFGIEINFSEEKISLNVRLCSNNQFPEDLVFDDRISIEIERENWSKKININVNELIQNKVDLTLQDLNNKWKAIFKYKNIFFLTSGMNYFLKGWIETDSITPGEEVFIFCDAEGLLSLQKYLNNSLNSFLKRLDFDGLDDYYLFRLSQWFPQDFTDQFNLNILSKPLINFNNILKINQSDYIIDLKPSITIKNLPFGNAEILKYKNYTEKIVLNEKIDTFTYKLPKNIKYNSDIEIVLREDCIRFITPFMNSKYFLEIPYRNSWSEITENESEYYCKGNDLKQIYFNNILYKQTIHHFKSEYNPSVPQNVKLSLRKNTFYKDKKDIMLFYLSSLGKLSFDKYFKSFEQILITHNQLELIKNFNFSKFLSLRYLESLGHIDVDYINQKILINEPQIILIPNNTFIGRQAILIGGRTPELISDLINKSSSLKVKVEIEDSISLKSGLQFIIPQVIKLYTQGGENDAFGESSLKQLAEHLKIKYSLTFLQPQLLITSSKIDEYEAKLIEDIGNDYEWTRQIFNPVTMRFELSDKLFNKELCLLKYHFTNYHIRYRLWFNGKCFIDQNKKNEGIDPLWGRYFIYHKMGMNILSFNDINNSLFVPSTVPLPRFINKALTLMSGVVPYQIDIKGMNYELYTNLIPSLTKNIIFQLGQQL